MLALFEVVLMGMVTVSPIHGMSSPASGKTLPTTDQFRREPVGVDPSDHGGDAQNLPVGCAHDPEHLVYWARNHMPEVRRAMDEFARRGYVAVPAADTAVSGCQQGIPMSGVTLAYVKPGAFIDSAHVVAPTIVVLTRIQPISGEPATQVSAGLIVADGAASRIFSGDSLAMFRHTDPSFDIRPATFGGGGPRREPLEREGFMDPTNPFFNPNSRFNHFVRCTGWSAVSCVTTTMLMGGAHFAPLKMAAILGAPEIGLAIIAVCTLGAGIGCISHF